MSDRPDLQSLISLLEVQRAVLGDAAVDFALAAVREKLAAEPVPAGPPRLRQVSVLFCDIADSTAMLQHLGAEDALEVIGAALQRFAQQVQEAGGKVLRFTGDGLKAAFGSEQTREDDVQRAVAAGLAILDEARAHAQRIHDTHRVANFGVRVGIDTGPVVLGGSVEADNTAMGHAVHIAARIEQAAPAGELRISHRTWVQVRGLFEVDKEPLLWVKGSDKALQTYLVRGAAPRVERVPQRGALGATPPMVGRDAELARVLALIPRAGRQASLRAATVLGEAGVGKSRLLHELQQALPPTGRLLLLARAQPSGELRPYGLLRDLLARWLRIADDDDAQSARRKLVEGVAPLNGESGEMAAHLIGRLIGLDFPDSPHIVGVEGRELRQRAYQALRHSLHALAAREPLVLVLDDLHWADDGSLDFVQQLIEAEEPAPMAVVTTARPTLLERRPAWLTSVAAHERLDLAPLDSPQGEALAAALLALLPEPPASLIQMLVARAEGNPFFMEELVRMLVDDDVIDSAGPQWQLREERLAALRVPETLVGVLQARLDALSEPERAALQAASIVGPVFWESALADVDAQAVTALPRLHQRALVQPREASAFEGTAEYAFHHQLLHEVTYGTVLKAQRREGHARVAQWLAPRVAERASEFLAATAEHYDRAGDSAQALAHYDRASKDAGGRSAFAASGAYVERALAQPALQDPKLRYKLLSRRQIAADALGHTARARQALADMDAHAEACDDDAMRAEVLGTRALQADRDGDLAAAARLAERAVLLAERNAISNTAALAHGELAWLAVMRADYAAADAHIGAGLPWARRAVSEGRALSFEQQLRLIGLESLLKQERYADAAVEIEALDGITVRQVERIGLLERRGTVEQQLGNLEAARRACTGMYELARQLGAQRYVAGALRSLAELAELSADPTQQRRLAQEMIEIAQRLGAEQHLANALEQEGAALQALGDTGAARERLAQAVALHRRGDRPRDALRLVARLAEIDHLAGDLAVALQQANEVLADPGAATLEPEVLLRCQQVLQATGDPRAPDLLQALHERMEHVQRQLPDDAARARLVEALPHWRVVDRLWRETKR